MNKFLSKLYIFLSAFFLMSCESEEAVAMPSAGNINTAGGNGSTLIVYYSYTNNTEQIVTDLKTLINADVIEVEPVNKNLDYAANNYAIGTEQLNKIQGNPNDESSYPAIDPVEVDMSKYSTVIIATPLWWSQMASNMQTFLFKYGSEMAGKNIGLIVSSHSSGISGVEADAKRLVPNGVFFCKSLWINASKHSQRKSLLEQWLQDVDYAKLPSNTSNTMNLTVNNHTLTVDLVQNSSTEALLNLLKVGDITYEAHDYGNFEKVGDIGHTLPQNNEDINTVPGDIILYQGNNICIYYDTNSWSFTRLGKIRNVSQSELKSILGTGNVMVTLSLDNASGISQVQSANAKQHNFYNINGSRMAEEPTQGIYIENGVKRIKQ